MFEALKREVEKTFALGITDLLPSNVTLFMVDEPVEGAQKVYTTTCWWEEQDSDERLGQAQGLGINMWTLTVGRYRKRPDTKVTIYMTPLVVEDVGEITLPVSGNPRRNVLGAHVYMKREVHRPVEVTS